MFTAGGRQFGRVDAPAGDKVMIPIKSFPQGVYFMRLSNNHGKKMVMKGMHLH
jgi:hypothetical protein